MSPNLSLPSFSPPSPVLCPRRNGFFSSKGVSLTRGTRAPNWIGDSHHQRSVLRSLEDTQCGLNDGG